MNCILVIDDEQQIRKLLSRMLELEGYEVFQATDCQSGLKQLAIHKPQVVLCDVFLPDGNGVELVSQLKVKLPTVEIILLTAHGNIPDGVQAIKNGAFDYITKGDDNNKIIPLINRATQQALKNLRLDKLEQQINRKYSFESIIGQSEIIQSAITLARKVAGTDVPVLLTGETGTGKEIFAQAIHQNSTRRKGNFVAINCSAFSRELLESEMFGYKSGAFTGAQKEKKGLFEEANNGTIFLDEIGEMPFELQAKLLRVLETREYIKIGDTRPTKTNIRIIAATNRNLPREIEADRFREDLFYRLSVFHIQLPPLRERQQDIILLAQTFIKKFATQLSRLSLSATPEYLQLLKEQPWKGNVRELRNVIERSIIVASGNELTKDDLPLDFYKSKTNNEDNALDLSTIEKIHIRRVLEITKGNKTEAAHLLQIGLTTLYRKIEEYKL